ncbi:DUF2254 domain-containing protein [Zeaxanthinibacter enoshimensis]|uniref:Putative membrane protein n=1 Tax=Zeaxanthinibacter enoshimensis TaxID=392009 RepID=A0A4R6TRW3_9FLAO|nr:DUF2254 domain-containing protein [Zeaxanthinibacter enoshimensis]TDQ33067.1 putative membrane protein [Zeaxanthinibacter enoshimensis]
MNKIQFLWGKLVSTFWFIPILIVVLAIGMAIGLLYLDNLYNYQPSGVVQLVFSGSADSARSVLSTISGAMIGVAGTVFSLTLVALTLASSQFGPRLLNNFMHDRLNQVVLGTYIATYVYCLLVLNSVSQNDSLQFIPTISVFMAILATVANIILLIVFIHHIAISIQADRVIADISSSLSRNMKTLFPDQLGEGNEKPTPNLDEIRNKFQQNSVLLAGEGGYLQYVDEGLVTEIASELDILLLLQIRPGAFVVEHQQIGEIYSLAPISPGDLDRIQDAFIYGQSRTTQQDAEFSIHQMVEIAARALSPGINDPFTAISCVDNLCSTLCYLTRVQFPLPYRYDEENVLRVVTDSLTFEGMLNAAFNQIRQFAVGSPSVMIRLVEALKTIHTLSEDQEQREAVERHTRMIVRAAEKHFDEKNDLQDLKERSNFALQT